jgi:hypothetical protein
LETCERPDGNVPVVSGSSSSSSSSSSSLFKNWVVWWYVFVCVTVSDLWHSVSEYSSFRETVVLLHQASAGCLHLFWSGQRTASAQGLLQTPTLICRSVCKACQGSICLFVCLFVIRFSHKLDPIS